MSEEPSIYERIGGEEGIEGLLDEFYTRVTSDSVLKSYFIDVSMERVRKMQKMFFCEVIGGPHHYDGKPLAEIHKNMEISRYEFDRFVKILVETLKDRGISDKDGREVVAKINLFASEIISDVEFG